MSEAELEQLVQGPGSDEVRFVLGKLLIEGSDKVTKNVTKGVNWLKVAIKNGSLDALEYKAYFDVRFDKQPRVKKIQDALETVAEKTKSPRACNTLGEFYQI
mmetsp:Transcript_4931/g.3533  ORF Transcript_4931/g.3533 Transcript_4931/m.3533 type:complete len:102 (+) Transcript_4931:44-349(+)